MKEQLSFIDRFRTITAAAAIGREVFLDRIGSLQFFFSLINFFLDGSFFFHPELSIVARCWGVRGLSGLRGAIRNLFGCWSLVEEFASAKFLLCKFGPYFISSTLFFRQIFLARKIRIIWGIKEKLARSTDVKHLKLEYKMQFFPMENTIVLTSGVAATNKRWCCLFCSLHNLYISKELKRLILKCSIRADFWWKKPLPAVSQKWGWWDNSQKTEECYFLPGDEVAACSFSF